MVKHLSVTPLSRLLKAAEVPIYVLDENQRLVYFNQALGQLTGCEEDKLLNQICRYHATHSRLHHEIIAGALAPPPVITQEKTVSGIISLDAIQQVHHRLATFFSLPLENGFGVLVVLGENDLSEAEMVQFHASRNDRTQETVQAQKLHQMLSALHRHQANQFQFDHLPGTSPQHDLALRQAKLATQTSEPVLILGPVGAGKETLANTIHFARGPESSGGLFPIDCRVLSSELIESTIRALYNRRLSDSGKCHTVLLTDIDMIAPDLEPFLCAAIKEQRPDIRLVGTSPLEPKQWKKLPRLAEQFGVITIRLLGLAEMPFDIPLFAQWFLERQNRHSEVQKTGFAADALDLLKQYHWRENLDELSEVVKQAHAHAAETLIRAVDIPERLHHVRRSKTVRKKTESIPLDEFLAKIELELIERALRIAKGNKAKAARLLGMNRPRLYRRMLQLGLIEPIVPDFKLIDTPEESS